MSHYCVTRLYPPGDSSSAGGSNSSVRTTQCTIASLEPLGKRDSCKVGDVAATKPKYISLYSELYSVLNFIKMTNTFEA